MDWRLIGQQVLVRTCGEVVQIFAGEQVVVTRVLHLSGRSTNPEHYPPHKIAYTLQTVVWCRAQAEQIGPGAVAVVAELSQVNALRRLRAIQGIVRLRDRYDDARLDAACARALEVGDPSCRTVKGILAAGTEHDGQPAPAPATAPAFLRGPDASDETVRRYLQPLRDAHNALPPAAVAPTIRQTTGWLTCRPDRLTDDEREQLSALLGRCPDHHPRVGPRLRRDHDRTAVAATSPPGRLLSTMTGNRRCGPSSGVCAETSTPSSRG
ncbi:hypothetical protein ACFVKB_17485 [Rhodococcus sp. NPDC127530]|uniref:hypothetical protein n=1 Tax=unclassified Rhodococcus (in: high G+C Gram-positive bacteria) TaxID=192944 RepID=UPI0036342873